MPDVSRSDSQRSDTSLKPRVSFNRDVHVKRIVTRENKPLVVGALSGDGAGHLVATPVRRERLGRLSRHQLAQEAAKVIGQAGSVDCVTSQGSLPGKFFTLPARRKHHRGNSESPHSSQERVNVLRRRSEELGVTSLSPPRKPPRTFATGKPPAKPKNSILNIFRRNEKEQTVEPKKSNLSRSRSDASNLKSKSSGEAKVVRKRTGSESEEILGHVKTKKTQLSPIIEVTQREDYFSQKSEDLNSNKENVNVKKDVIEEKKAPPRRKWEKTAIKKNKESVDEVDSGLLNLKNENNKKNSSKHAPEVVIIDVDKAENISKTKSKKINSTLLKNKLKSLTTKRETKKDLKNLKNESKVTKNGSTNLKSILDLKTRTVGTPKSPETPKSPKIQEAIKSLEKQVEKSPDMIHSSQQPVDKLPLTRGRKVDTMVKRLSTDKNFMPPKTNHMVTPTVTVQHNNNQPFSYTQPRAISPERSYPRSKSPFDKPSSPVIYAQVVVGNGDPDTPGGNKQTIHTVYTNGKKHLPHSDSDEGLGYEESSGFSRKYEQEKAFTHFGDDKFTQKNEFYKDVDKFDEEFPITPKFKTLGGFSNGFGYNENSKYERTAYVDPSVRGRGDGMDSRRRESLTENPIENGQGSKVNGNNANINGRSDLSYRRDLLESRIKSRRIGEKQGLNRDSPEFSPKSYSPNVNKYVSEKTSRYYRHGSNSPVGYTEKYVSETKIDRNGEKFTKESRTKSKIGEKKHLEYQNDYNRNHRVYDVEPKSLDSQASDYRSSPENLNTRKSYFVPSHEIPQNYRSLHSNRYKSKTDKISKDRDHYKSNPEINQRNYDPAYKYEDRNRFVSETYHDSLRRPKHDEIDDSPQHTERYFDSMDTERKDKFGDSGIENDFRRDSGENVRIVRSSNQHYRGNREFSNESEEDEGFASSLLIASERQHTEDNIGNLSRKHRREYDSDREVRGYHNGKDDDYRNHETADYKRSIARQEFVHRERSIDDGSHFDPRIDKDLDKEKTLKKVEKKPPKPAKKTSLEKVKSLFSRDSAKKKREKEVAKENMVREESLRARYSEYRGSNDALDRTLRRDNHSENSQNHEYSGRRRLSTPSPSPTRTRERETGTLRHDKDPGTHTSWFKSLDRMSRKKDKVNKSTIEKETIVEDELPKPPPTKNLRFFGDTDVESNDSVRYKSSLKRPAVHAGRTSTSSNRTRSQSTRDLHNISEEFRDSDDSAIRRNGNHKSMQNVSEADKDVKGSRMSLKPPASPTRRTDVAKRDESRNRRRRNEVSSVESSTEGDSSQQSQRSVVYLHAATVGDIPGPGYLPRNSRRAASREELTSVGSSRIQPQVKTLSRSFSMLAPWTPRHKSEGYDIDYTQYPAKPSRNPKVISKSGGKTAKEKSNKKLSDSRKSNQNLSTLSRKSKSKENVSHTLNRKTKEELPKGSSTTLYKKKERPIKENSRYTRDDKKLSNKSMSVESLGGGKSKMKDTNHIVSRSLSMPRDPDKSAGWFKMSGKKNTKKTVSSQRL